MPGNGAQGFQPIQDNHDYITAEITAAAKALLPAQKGETPDTAERAAAMRDWIGWSSWIQVRDRHDFMLAETVEGQRYGLQLWERMELDGHLFNALQTRKATVLALPRQILAWDKSPAAREQRDFVGRTLDQVQFHQDLKDLLDAVAKGYSISEIMWVQRDGRWVPSDIKSRAQGRFLFGWENELRLWGPWDPWPGTPMPQHKFLVASFDPRWDNAYGNAVLSKCFWPWWFKKHGLKFWMIFLEKFGAPTVVGKFPPGSSDEQKTALLDAAAAVREETGVVIPDNQMLELLEAQRQGATVSYEAFCDYLDKQISQAVVGATLASGEASKGGGNRAMAQVHQETLMNLVSDDAQMLMECVNRDLIRPLIEFNFGPPGPGMGYPRLHIETESKETGLDMANRDKVIWSMGLPISKQQIQDKYALAQPESEDDALPPPAAGGGLGLAPTASDGGFAEFREGRRVVTHPDLLADRAVASLSDGLKAPFERALDAIRTGADYDEARDRLYAAYPSLSYNELQESLECALFVADLRGRSEIPGPKGDA